MLWSRMVWVTLFWLGTLAMLLLALVVSRQTNDEGVFVPPDQTFTVVVATSLNEHANDAVGLVNRFASCRHVENVVVVFDPLQRAVLAAANNATTATTTGNNSSDGDGDGDTAGGSKGAPALDVLEAPVPVAWLASATGTELSALGTSPHLARFMFFLDAARPVVQRMSCQDVEFAFSVLLSMQSALVGFAPRIHALQADGTLQRLRWDAIWHSSFYSMVSLNAAFVARTHVQAVAALEPTILGFAETHNCRDALVNLVVADRMRVAPLWVDTEVDDFEAVHPCDAECLAHESECLDALVRLFGRNPLVFTANRAVPIKKSVMW